MANKYPDESIPMSVFSKGRTYGDVLEAFMASYETAHKEASKQVGKSGEEIFADTLACVAYRMYLLGVQDGMEPAGTDGRDSK